MIFFIYLALNWFNSVELSRVVMFFVRAVDVARLETKHDWNAYYNAENQDKRNWSLAWNKEGFVVFILRMWSVWPSTTKEVINHYCDN